MPSSPTANVQAGFAARKYGVPGYTVQMLTHCTRTTRLAMPMQSAGAELR
jgi:hypothetical protein